MQGNMSVLGLINDVVSIEIEEMSDLLYLGQVPVAADILLEVVNKLSGLHAFFFLSSHGDLQLPDVEIHDELAIIFR